MLNFKANFTMKDIDDDINTFMQGMQDHIVESLKAAGISFVDKARARTKSEGGFGNITWNLRASIACLIVKDHQIVFRYSPPISKAPEGNQKGIAYAEEIALLVDDGDIMLVCVAGMEYAAAVEDNDIDVITGSSLKFEKEFKALLAA